MNRWIVIIVTRLNCSVFSLLARALCPSGLDSRFSHGSRPMVSVSFLGSSRLSCYSSISGFSSSSTSENQSADWLPNGRFPISTRDSLLHVAAKWTEITSPQKDRCISCDVIFCSYNKMYLYYHARCGSWLLSTYINFPIPYARCIRKSGSRYICWRSAVTLWYFCWCGLRDRHRWSSSDHVVPISAIIAIIQGNWPSQILL